MKSALFFIVLLTMYKTTSLSQVCDTLRLPDPVKQGGKPLMEALNDRHSSRDFSATDLPRQQLANLLWAANGINRPDGRRTAPSARNKQEIDIYVSMVSGVYFYDAVNNQLICISGEDIREKTGSQAYVKEAAANLLYVCDKSRAASGDETGILVNAAFTSGAIAQNVYLYCASEGLGCVVRGSFDKELLRGLLSLNEQQVVIMAQTVGVIK